MLKQSRISKFFRRRTLKSPAFWQAEEKWAEGKAGLAAGMHYTIEALGPFLL